MASARQIINFGIATLVPKLSQLRIAVVGDFCLDAKWIVDTSRPEISIETGYPAYQITEQKYTLGGAGNVVSDLIALGIGKIHAIGLIGADPFGIVMLQQLDALGVETCRLHTSVCSRYTPVYGKPESSGCEMARLDFGNANAVSSAVIEQTIVKSLNDLADHIDFVIVNQQLSSGWCTRESAIIIRDILVSRFAGRHIVDSRHFRDCFEPCCHKTSNALLKGVRGSEPLLVTRAGLPTIAYVDMMVLEREPFLPSIESAMIDPIGSGDTFVAMFSAAIAAGCDLEIALMLADIAARVTVCKIGMTGAPTISEIADLVKQIGQ
jgi:bifunctional ADP-heptose synthase (sugar kinase/adenylyltransferase)